MKNLFRLTVVSVLAGLMAAPPAFAQLEEIIVTAERRETGELTTAISVEVFTPADLALDKLQTVEDLQNSMPNLTITNAGFTIQSVNIRGVGNAVGNPNIQPGVAVFQDGMMMSETVVIQQAFMDVETIEVLRGPQGTFVGQSSTGGAIRINAARPNFDGINGHVETRFGDFADVKLAGAINLPLTDTISTRFAYSAENRDSYWTNASIVTFGPDPWKVGPHPGNTENQNIRASLLWEPSENVSVLARAEFNKNTTGGDAPFVPNPNTYANPNDPDGVGESPFFRFASPTNASCLHMTCATATCVPYPIALVWMLGIRLTMALSSAR